MISFYVRHISELDPRQLAATLRLLDACAGASAYQYPYAGEPTDLLLQVERDGELCFSGRASVGLAASRLLPFLKTLVFNRGPVAGSQAELLDGFARVGTWARQQRFVKMQVMPDLELQSASMLADELKLQGWVINPVHRRYTLRLDISLPEAQLLASFPKACRYRVARAQREGIRIEYGTTAAALAAFMQVYRQMTARKGLSATAPALFEALWQLRQAESNRIGLIMAYCGEDLLGANLLFRSGHCAEYLFGAVHSENPVLHGDVTAGYPLQWGAMQWAKAAGCTLYDFGGFDPLATSGPARLKKAFVHNPAGVELFPAATLDLMPAVAGVLGSLRRINSGR